MLESVGGVLAYSFEGFERLGLVPSDLTAGLALVRITQKEQESKFMQEHLRQQLLVRQGLGIYCFHCVATMCAKRIGASTSVERSRYAPARAISPQ